MSTAAGEIREGLMEAMGRITSFWGFSKIMGQLNLHDRTGCQCCSK